FVERPEFSTTVRPEPVEGRQHAQDSQTSRRGFDRLSPNGVLLSGPNSQQPFALSLSKGGSTH
ncbi:MAG TPA: hypothetical protein VGE47_08155, partial [Burkholderiaceae bacterium]